MFPYVLIYLLSSVFSLLETVKFSNSKRLLAVLSLIFAIFSGIKSGIGADYIGYVRYFYDPLSDGKSEILYSTAAYVFNYLGFTHHTFFFAQSSLFFLLLYRLITNISSRKFILVGALLSFFIFSSQYFLGGVFGQYRQALSILFAYFSLLYFYDKNFLSSVVCMFLAVGFHVTALVFMPFLLLLLFNPGIISLTFIGLLSIAIYYVGAGNLIMKLSSVMDLLPFIREGLASTILSYIDAEKYGAAYQFSGLIIAERMVVGLIALFIFIKSPKSLFGYMALSYLLSVFVLFALSDVSIFAQRLSRVFKFSEIFIIPHFVYSYLKADMFRVLVVAMVVLLLLVKPAIIIHNDPSKYLPYKSFFYE